MANIPTAQNNPGDLKQGGQIATFNSPQQGMAALMNDLTGKIDGTSSTGLNAQSSLADFSNVWAPASDGNDPAQYTANLANQLKVSPNTPIGTLAPQIGQFADAIAHNEGYNPQTPAPGTSGPATPASPSQPSPLPGVTPTSNSPSFLQKFLFGAGAGALGTIGVLTAGEGGEALEPEAAALVGDALGEGAADTAGTAAESATADASSATPEAASDTPTKPGLISRAVSTVSNIANSTPAKIAEGAGLFDTVKNMLSGNNNSSDSSSSSAPSPANQDLSDPAVEGSLNTSNAITQAVQASANNTQAGSRLMQTQAGIEGAQAIGTNGYTPDIENDRQNWAQAIVDAGNKGMELDDTENQLLDAEGGKGDISAVASKAKEIVQKTLPSTDWDEAYKQIDADAKSYQANFGGGGNIVPLGSSGIGRIRKEGYKGFDRNSSTAKNGARKAMGSAANHHMLERTKHKDLIGGLHKEKQRLINAQKVMKHLNGKKAPGHKGMLPSLLKQYGTYVGVAIGDKIGGALGGVLGAMIGKTLSGAVDKKFGRTEFESPALKMGVSILQKKYPKVAELVKKELKKYEIDVEKEQKARMTRKALPAPAIPLGASAGGTGKTDPNFPASAPVNKGKSGVVGKEKVGGLHKYYQSIEDTKKAIGNIKRKAGRPKKIRANPSTAREKIT